jgi:hypothetical protein
MNALAQAGRGCRVKGRSVSGHAFRHATLTIQPATGFSRWREDSKLHLRERGGDFLVDSETTPPSPPYSQ